MKLKHAQCQSQSAQNIVLHVQFLKKIILRVIPEPILVPICDRLLNINCPPEYHLNRCSQATIARSFYLWLRLPSTPKNKSKGFYLALQRVSLPDIEYLISSQHLHILNKLSSNGTWFGALNPTRLEDRWLYCWLLWSLPPFSTAVDGYISWRALDIRTVFIS